MSNFDLVVTTASGTTSSFLFDTCGDAIDWLAGAVDDEEPAHQVTIKVTTSEGRIVSITIPNDASQKAMVRIDEETIH